MKYLELISKTKEEVAAKELKFKAKESKISGEKQILDVEREIANIEGRIESAQGAFPFSHETLYNLECELELAKRKVKTFKKNQKELF